MVANSVEQQAKRPSVITINMVAAAAYFLFGLSAEFLSIPPDYATPVWPAAGIALGFTIRYGALPLPGIFIGALVINGWVAYLHGLPLNITHLLFAITISLGAIFQAAFGRWLLTKNAINPFELQNASQILKFLLFAGPVGCLVNSLNGSLMLGTFGIISWELWFTNWLTWWVGDSVGALVITPFVLRLLTENKAESASQKWHSTTLPVAFLVLIILSFFYVRNLEQGNRQSLVADAGGQLEAIFKVKIFELTVVLNAVKSFFEASEFVSLEEFEHFSSNLIQGQSAIHVIEWLPYIQHEQRAATERYMHENGYPEFHFLKRDPRGTLTSAPNKEDYLPILYLYPQEGNQKIHGLDVLSLPYREPQSRLALSTGAPYASNPLRLIQDVAGQTSYILLAPAAKMQGQGYKGLVQIIFHVNSLLDTSLINRYELDGLAISDTTHQHKKIQVFGNAAPHNNYSWQSKFQFLNRELTLQLTPTDIFLKKISSWQSYTILIGGLLYVALLEAVLLSLLTRQQAIQKEVHLKTREIAQAKEDAELANRTKTDFLTSMSHELRTPLNAIIGFTHRVLNQSENPLNERNSEALTIVKKNAKHLLGLINNLLDITKVEKGKLELEYEQTQLKELLCEAQEQFSLASSQKRNTITVSCETEGSIEADPMRIRQVIMNLLSNAVKFTSSGTISIRLFSSPSPSERKDQSNQDGYIIEIADTGIGIADEDLPKLFNKFQQVGNTRRLNSQGTGLGLALSREIIELHGGTIWVKSDLSEGTTFSCWLPRHHKNKTNV